MVLTEGGWFLAQRDRRTPMLITVTRQEKVYFNLGIVADGTAAQRAAGRPRCHGQARGQSGRERGRRSRAAGRDLRPAPVQHRLAAVHRGQGRRAATYPGAVFSPALFEAGTSLYPWTSRGVPGYGVCPYFLDNDQLIGMQGTDERIGVETLLTGTDFMYRLFDRFRVR
jgi:hypothetical protein